MSVSFKCAINRFTDSDGLPSQNLEKLNPNIYRVALENQLNVQNFLKGPTSRASSRRNMASLIIRFRNRRNSGGCVSLMSSKAFSEAA